MDISYRANGTLKVGRFTSVSVCCLHKDGFLWETLQGETVALVRWTNAELIDTFIPAHEIKKTDAVSSARIICVNDTKNRKKLPFYELTAVPCVDKRYW